MKKRTLFVKLWLFERSRLKLRQSSSVVQTIGSITVRFSPSIDDGEVGGSIVLERSSSSKNNVFAFVMFIKNCNENNNKNNIIDDDKKFEQVLPKNELCLWNISVSGIEL